MGSVSMLSILPCCFLFFLIGIIFLGIYNRFVRIKQHVKESWAGIDVELKRRYELIPNLVETVKGYASHEKELFAMIAEERTRALSSTGSPGEQAVDEQPLARHLGQLMALAESYPDLKANQSFLQLQEELVDTEDRLAAARRFYNGNVREYNTLRKSFPSNLVAESMGFKEADLFEVEESLERSSPSV